MQRRLKGNRSCQIIQLIAMWSEGHKWIVRYGDEECCLEDFQYYLHRMSDINVVTSKFCTMVHFAAASAQAGLLLPFLVSQGAHLHTSDENGATPLHWAASNCKTTSPIKYLLSNGAQINWRDLEGNTALHYAAECGNIQGAKLLLNNSKNRHSLINSPNYRGKTPLQAACEQEESEMISFLILLGAPVDSQCLRSAIEQDSEEVLRSLLQRFFLDQQIPSSRLPIESLVDLATRMGSFNAAKELTRLSKLQAM